MFDRRRGSLAKPPLTPAVFHILLALSEGARHGYAIMRAVEDAAGPEIAMGPGTIYGSLSRMEDSGLVRELPRSEVRDYATPSRGRPRKYFCLTEAGRQALEGEARRLDRLAGLARDRNLLPGDPRR